MALLLDDDELEEDLESCLLKLNFDGLETSMSWWYEQKPTKYIQIHNKTVQKRKKAQHKQKEIPYEHLTFCNER